MPTASARSRSAQSPSRSAFESTVDNLKIIRRAGDTCSIERSQQSLNDLREVELKMFSKVPNEYLLSKSSIHAPHVESTLKVHGLTRRPEEEYLVDPNRAFSINTEHIGARLCDPNRPIPLQWKYGDPHQQHFNVKSKYAESLPRGTRRDEIEIRRREFLSKIIPKIQNVSTYHVTNSSKGAVKPPLIVSSVFVPSCAAKHTHASMSRKGATRISTTKMIR